MEFTAKQIAEILKGKVEGNPDVKISNISRIEDGIPGTLSFLANPKYSKFIYTTRATIVLINENFRLEKNVEPTLIRVKDAYQAFADLLEFYNNNIPNKVGIEEMAYIHPTAKIGKNVYIGAFAYIDENVVIADNAKIYPHVYLSRNVAIKENTILASGVKVYNDCKIGANCMIHSGVVIGCDGFGFAPSGDADYKKVPQVGNVIVEDNVEIGANTTIDRATIGATIIRKGVKLDNLIQIAHNVEIGENTVIAAQAGVSGSTKIGKDCMFGGQVGIVGHLSIADRVKIAAQSGIPASVKEEGAIIQGSPAFKITDYQKSYVMFKRLPDLNKRVDDMQREIQELKKLLQEKK